jgi:hypothetical protein
MAYHPPRYSPAGVLFLVTAIVGFGISLYLYLVPLTGVTGTVGALMVTISCGLLAVAALIFLQWPVGEAATFFRVLALLGVLGVFAAAWFLHGFWLMVAMVIALVFLLFDFAAKKGVPS